MSDSFFTRHMLIPQWLFFLLLILPAAGFVMGSKTQASMTPPPSRCENFVPPVEVTPGYGGVACTMDARECPDGSYVSRQPPNCEFAPCPGETSGGSGGKVSQFCGGIAGIQCPRGQKCILEGTYPDAGGTCR